MPVETLLVAAGVMDHRPCLPDSVPVIGPSTRVKKTFSLSGMAILAA
jgi:glycine/D-amino acid oxidase-like deaminating enzyme